jgi:hypothetical protein
MVILGRVGTSPAMTPIMQTITFISLATVKPASIKVGTVITVAPVIVFRSLAK